MCFKHQDSSIHNSNSVFLTSPYLQVDQAAAGLLALGLKQGDRLGMWGPNTYEWILIQFATAKAGIILVSQMLKKMFILLNIVPMLTLAAYLQLVNKYLLISS